MSVSALAFTALAFTACGGGDDDGATPDAAHVNIPDAMPMLPDAPVGGCALQTTIGLPQAQGVFLVTSQTPNFYAWQGNTGAPGGTASFYNFNVNTPGSVGTPLDLTMQDCSATGTYCFFVLGNYTMNAMNQVDGDVYLPSAGTVTVTAAGAAVGDTFTATTSGVHLVHVVGNAPAPDGCAATLTDSTITGTLMAGKRGETVRVITSIVPLRK